MIIPTALVFENCAYVHNNLGFAKKFPKKTAACAFVSQT